MKYWLLFKAWHRSSRSREGAWIEIDLAGKSLDYAKSRSREGAWIEMDDGLPWNTVGRVAPARERGLKFLLYNEENMLLT